MHGSFQSEQIISSNRNSFESHQLPPSRPISPMEQIEIMEALDRELNKVIKDPSEIDLERYYYYVENGTDETMIASLPSNQFEQFARFISPSLRETERAQEINNCIVDEIKKTYVGSMKKTIVDYVLMNLEERKRLKIEWLPKHFNHK